MQPLISKITLKQRILLAVGSMVAIVFLIFVYFFALDRTTLLGNAMVTNITDTGATISFTTNKPVDPEVYFSEKDNWLPLIGFLGKNHTYDERTLTLSKDGDYKRIENPDKSYTHVFRLRNLAPDKQYHWRLGGSVSFMKPEKTSAKFTTQTLKEEISTPDIIYGQIQNIKDKKDVLLQAEVIDDSQNKLSDPITLIPAENGTYTFDKSSLIRKDSQQKFSGAELKSLTLALTVLEGNRSPLLVSLALSRTKPLDNVVLSDAAAGDSSAQSKQKNEFSKTIPLVSAQTQRSAAVTPASLAQESETASTTPTGGDGVEAASGDNRASIKTGANTIDICFPGDAIGGGDEADDGNQDEDQDPLPVIFPEPEPADPAPSVPVDPTPPAPPPVIVEQPTLQRELDDILSSSNRNPDATLQGYWQKAKLEQNVEQAVGGDVSLSTAGNPYEALCFASSSLQCQPQLREFIKVEQDPTSNSFIKSRGPLYPYCLLVHEAIHYKQRTCRGTIAANSVLREMAAEAKAVERCGVLANAPYRQGDYIFMVNSVNGQPGSRQWFRAPQAVRELDTKLGLSGFSIADFYTCDPAAMAYYDANPALAGQFNSLNVTASINISAGYDSAVYMPTATSQSSIPGVLGKVHAQAQPTPNEINESGVYSFFANGKLIATQKIELEEDQRKLRIRYFYDKNNSNDFDQCEQLANDVTIELKQEAEQFKYELNSGWNLIALPAVALGDDEQLLQASDLLDAWNEGGVSVTKLAVYKDQQFTIFTNRGDEYGQDFEILPGQGMFVFNSQGKRDASILASAVEESVPVVLNNGWNLVGIISNKQYTSDQLLTSIRSSGMGADTISSYENGLYQSVIFESDALFGNNYLILPKKGYFIRVAENGDKTFKP